MASRANRILRAMFRTWWRWMGAVELEPTVGLQECVDCRADMVSPIDWRPLDDERWLMELRCGQCGHVREAVATDAEAEEYNAALDRHQAEIERALADTDMLRMADEVDRFAEALRRDLIDVGDFERYASRRAP
jgi:hypothetical protein